MNFRQNTLCNGGSKLLLLILLAPFSAAFSDCGRKDPGTDPIGSQPYSDTDSTDVAGIYAVPGDWTGEYELAAMPNQLASAIGMRMFPILLSGDIGFGPVSTITVLDPADGQTLMINGTAYSLTTGASWSFLNVQLSTPMHVVMDPAGTGQTPRLRIDGNTPADWTAHAHIGRAYSLPTTLAAALSVYTGDQPWVLREYQAGLNLEAVGSGYSLGARFTDTDRTIFELALSTGWTVRGTVTSRTRSEITVDITEVSGFPTNGLTGSWTFTALQ
ncbi:MAG: hypothetical protein GXP62_14275 [Oligoflexia bacterium]|nr:hypothetical protein [Oligoflexia bacterium]